MQHKENMELVVERFRKFSEPKEGKKYKIVRMEVSQAALGTWTRDYAVSFGQDMIIAI